MLTKEKWDIVEEQFSHLKDAVFLNAAHVVIPPKNVLSAYHDFVDNYVSQFAKGIVEDAWAEVGNTRETIAALLNAEKREIGFVKNTAEAISIIANGFPFQKGDNIVICDQEHPSNFYPWIRLNEMKGVELKIVENVNWDILEEKIIQRCDKNTKAIALSAVQFTTGVFCDLKKIGRYCRKEGILFIVDGIQAVGRMLIDVKEMNIDYLGCGGNKGLLSMLGAGFVYCKSSLIEQIIPPYVSYQSVENFESPPALIEDYHKIHWKNDARRFESGNLNYSGVAAINAGVKLLNSIGLGDIEAHIIEFEKRLLEGIKDLNIQYRTPINNAGHLSGVLCLYYPLEREEEIKMVLEKYKIFLTIRGGYLRLAINFYNSESDLNTIIKALREIFNK